MLKTSTLIETSTLIVSAYQGRKKQRFEFIILSQMLICLLRSRSERTDQIRPFVGLTGLGDAFFPLRISHMFLEMQLSSIDDPQQ